MESLVLFSGSRAVGSATLKASSDEKMEIDAVLKKMQCDRSCEGASLQPYEKELDDAKGPPKLMGTVDGTFDSLGQFFKDFADEVDKNPRVAMSTTSPAATPRSIASTVNYSPLEVNARGISDLLTRGLNMTYASA